MPKTTAPSTGDIGPRRKLDAVRGDWKEIAVGRTAFVVAATAAMCAQAGALPAHAASPRATVEGQLPQDLKDQIVGAIGQTDRPMGSRFEARRRAREAGDDATAVLRSEGYYGAEVEPDVSEADPPSAFVRIQPGARFVFASPQLQWLAPQPDALTQSEALKAIGLVPGQPGRAADVINAEARLVGIAQHRGYADAAAAPREVIVDHADKTVRPTFRLMSGDKVLLGGLEIVSEGRTDVPWLKALVPWTLGAPYDPDTVAELELRLLDTGVYDSVTVGLAPRDRGTAEGYRPVVVSLSERDSRTLEAGASYSTSEGLGADAKWTRYNILGWADTVAFYGRVSNIDSKLGADLSLPHWLRPHQTLKATVAAYDLKTDAYDARGFGIRADVERRYRVTSFVTLGAAIDYSQTDEKTAITLSPLGRELVAVSGLMAISLDRSSDPLDPRRGWRLEGRAEPTYLLGDENLPYLKVQLQGSTYLPFGRDDRTVLAGRLKLGGIAGGLIPEVPASRRFYSGGGGSVRGYAYQAVGPRFSDNTPQGGLSMLEASLELRHNLTPRWGLVAFVDGGGVGVESTPTGDDFSAGAGIGVRYDLGFGPIRADIAVPLDRRSGDAAFQIYLSIGQSF